MASTLKDSLLHWRRKLEKTTDETAILNTIHKLSKVPITVDLLQDTGIGKSIRNLAKKSGTVGTKASLVLQSWRDVVASTPKNIEASPKLEHAKHSHKKIDYSSDEKSYDKYRKHDKYGKLKQSSGSSHKEKHSRDHSKHASDHSQHLMTKVPHSSKKKNELHSISSDYANKEINEKPFDLGKHAKFLEITKEFSGKRKADETMQIGMDYPKKPKKEYSETLDTHDAKKDQAFCSSDVKKYKNKISPNSNGIKEKQNNDVDQNLNGVPKQKKHKYEDSPSSFQSSVPKIEGANNSDHISKKKEKKSHKSNDSKDSKKSHSKKHKESKKPKSNQNDCLKIAPTEEFTSSEVRFEDCLGFNDIIVKKKKSSKSSSEKKGKHASVKQESKNKAIAKNSASTESKHNGILKTENPSSPDLLSSNLNVGTLVSTLPLTQPSYRPLPQRSYADSGPSKKKVLTNEDAIKFTSSRREKTSVYSGKKNAFTYTEVPTLVDCCIRVLIDNIDAIEYIGGAVPYFILKHVLIRCSAVQLHNIEDFNPYLLDETQELWEQHCKRDFRNYKRQDSETWRDLYWRATEEREIKLKSLTANITAARTTSTSSVRKVKLAYVDSFVKPPRDVARKQAKNGTALPVNLVVKAGPPSKATPRPVAPAINSAATSHAKEFVPKKPKVAPLMAKTLKSMRQCFRR